MHRLTGRSLFLPAFLFFFFLKQSLGRIIRQHLSCLFWNTCLFFFQKIGSDVPCKIYCLEKLKNKKKVVSKCRLLKFLPSMLKKYFLAYCIRISAKYTSASKSYLTHPYPSLENGKIKNYMYLIYTGCIGCQDRPSWRLTSMNVMTSLNVMVLSSQYGRRLQWKWLHYQKPTFWNERYARKKIYYGREGQIEKTCPLGSQSDITQQALWCQTVTLGTDFSIYPSHPW